MVRFCEIFCICFHIFCHQLSLFNTFYNNLVLVSQMSQAPDDSLIVKMLYMMGPSGSGKTTLSQQLATTYEQILGSGTVTSVSLDPANYLS